MSCKEFELSTVNLRDGLNLLKTVVDCYMR